MIKSLVAAAVIALTAVAFSPTVTYAQSSCSGWSSKCSARCKGVANPNCVSNCVARANTCRQSGCFFAAAEGRQVCNLKKS